jgi:hypothetical protein
MKLFKLAIPAALAASLILMAQDAPFVETMKSVATACGALKKMEKKTGTDAVRKAEQVAGGYETMIAFWRQRNAADAVKLSETGKAAAVRLASAAHAGDEVKAAAAFDELTATCQGCHEKHREEIRRYRIK